LQKNQIKEEDQQIVFVLFVSNFAKADFDTADEKQ